MSGVSPGAIAGIGGGMHWVYDLRGLDIAAWIERAADDLAAHRAAGDEVSVLVPETAGFDALRVTLARHGYAPQATSLGETPAWTLLPVPAAEAESASAC